MSALYEAFETDKRVESEVGIDLQYGGAFFTVRRAGGANKAFQLELSRLTRPLRRVINADLLPAEDFNRLAQQAFARTVLIGWRGVTDRAGNELEFNEQNFMKLMDDLPALWDAIFEAATQVGNFRKQQIQADGELLGN